MVIELLVYIGIPVVLSFAVALADQKWGSGKGCKMEQSRKEIKGKCLDCKVVTVFELVRSYPEEYQCPGCGMKVYSTYFGDADPGLKRKLVVRE